MSTKAIQVRIWKANVGAIAPDPATGLYAFQYYPQWLRKGIDLAPLTMPISDGADRSWRFQGLDEECFKKMPGMLSDSMPDAFGNDLINAWMSSNGVDRDSITELDRLAYMGRRGMGALEFFPAGGPPEDHSATPIAMKNLVEEARAVVTGSFDEKTAGTALQHIIRVGTSAGGARPKAVIAWNPTTNEVRSGQFDVPPGFEHWLIKFDGIGKDSALGSPADYGRIEYAYYLMAQSAGITMSACRLMEEGGRAHFMTRRFDRDGNVKHHIQTLCALAHLSYKHISTHSYNQYLTVVQDSLKLGDADAQEAFRRMAFNVAGRNQDDHTKNFSFILPKDGKWRLAPAYDVTHAYDPTNIWTKHHLMSVNGKFDGITREDLLTVAERFLIPDAAKILGEVNDAVQAWPQFASQAGLNASRADKIAKNHVPIGARPRGVATDLGVVVSTPLPETRSAKGGRKQQAR